MPDFAKALIPNSGRPGGVFTPEKFMVTSIFVVRKKEAIVATDPGFTAARKPARIGEI